ncbi:MAG: sigma-54 dependent transcriptional regulator [Pseudomonadota bacterium]
MSQGSPHLLLVEDETLLASAVRRHLERTGYKVVVAGDIGSARDTLQTTAKEDAIDLVLLDMRLPDGSGMDLLEQLSDAQDPLGAGNPAVIVMTAFGGLEDAVAAMKAGADDYLRKPVDLDELTLNIQRVLSQREVRRQLAASRSRERGQAGGEVAADYLGDTPAAAALREQVTRIARLGAAPMPPNVLVLGETGTGKGLLARALHERSERAQQPFVHVDCTALPADLVESELFGHRKGAFTGATEERTGLIEAAERGTVFLDEIGELPMETQSKLLAVLERRRVRRVGSSSEVNVDAWFIAATNRELEQEIEAGRFRADLYYRLKVLTLESPSLRERPDDVLKLAEHFVATTARRFGLPTPAISPEAASTLKTYHWPGNVRELSHVMERAVLMGGGELLTPALVAADAGLQSGNGGKPPTGMDALRGLTLAQAERLLIEEALARTDGNVSQAARELGVTRETLRYRLKQHGLSGT